MISDTLILYVDDDAGSVDRPDRPGKNWGAMALEETGTAPATLRGTSDVMLHAMRRRPSTRSFQFSVLFPGIQGNSPFTAKAKSKDSFLIIGCDRVFRAPSVIYCLIEID